MAPFKEHVLEPLELPYVDPFDMRRLHGGAEPWARFHQEYNKNDDIQVKPWQPEVWTAESDWTCRRDITSSKPINIPAWLCRMLGISGCMRFEETQVSTLDPQTGVNTVDASVFMLIRGSRSHTADIRMQQAPKMFGNAPGIVMTTRLRVTADAAGPFRAAAQGAVIASVRPVAEAFNEFGQRQVAELQARRRAEDDAHVSEWADERRALIRGLAHAAGPTGASARAEAANRCAAPAEGTSARAPVPALSLGSLRTPLLTPLRRADSAATTCSMATEYFDCAEDFHDAQEGFEPDQLLLGAASARPDGTADVVTADARGKDTDAGMKPLPADKKPKKLRKKKLFGRLLRKLPCTRPPATVS
ncbi:hypothetical protein WJX81_001586 [Elliptochloris bilobata]|uniref:Uncharacterized protein n=1 Tax=Elliptochloris bilobata TaxID=381761 RepID=A0AAW1QNP4_9CHLO